MAQLVKLADYVSRYEIDIYRYPSRYVRLKKERWERLKQDWEATRSDYPTLPLMQHYEERVSTLWDRTKGIFKRSSKEATKEEVKLPTDWQLRHKTMEELRAAYSQELFAFQINWASSTVSEISRLKHSYYQDKLLHFFLTELPDTFFIFYEPVLYARNAPVDCDIIILTPASLWIVNVLEGDEETIYSSLEGRYWQKRQGDHKEAVLHPSVSLKRSKTVIQSILEAKNLQVNIKTAVMAKDSYIDVGQGSQSSKLIDRRNLHEFKESMLKMTAPIKHTQLKIADVLLDASLTISESRDFSDTSEENIENSDEIR